MLNTIVHFLFVKGIKVVHKGSLNNETSRDFCELASQTCLSRYNLPLLITSRAYSTIVKVELAGYSCLSYGSHVPSFSMLQVKLVHLCILHVLMQFSSFYF
jgi:hypothetical protein